MLCDECQDLLSDYIDGVMELGEQAKIENHVSECDPCRSVRDDLLQIVQFSRSLPLHSPSTLVWARIQAHIEETPWQGLPPRIAKWLPSVKGSHFKISAGWAPFAAAVVLSLVVVVALQYRSITNTALDHNRQPVAPEKQGAPGFSASTVSGIPEMEQEISRLKANVEQRSSAWNPEVRTTFDRDILHVDQTLERCRHELSDNPSDDMCREMMMNAYREKVRLLEGFTDF